MYMVRIVNILEKGQLNPEFQFWGSISIFKKVILDTQNKWNKTCINIFLWFGFTPRKVEQPPESMELKEKEDDKNEKHMWKLIRNNPKIKKIILDLKPFRSLGEEKHSVGKEFHSLVAPGKNC